MLCLLSGIAVAVIGVILLVVSLTGPVGTDFFLLLVSVVCLIGSVVLIVVAMKLVRKEGPGHPFLAQVGEVNGYVINAVQPRKWEHRAYEVFLSPQAKNSPPELSVKVPTRSPIPIQFTGTTWFDTLCKNIGLAKEYQTGDKEFDEAVYIRCASDGFAKKVLADPARRRAITTLRQMGFQVVEATGTHVEARWNGFVPSIQSDPNLPDRAAEQLFLLAAGIPAQDPEFTASKLNTRLIALVLLWFALIAGAALVPCVFVWVPVRVWSFLGLSAGVAVAALLVLGWVAAWLLRGESVSHDRWATLMLGALCLLPLGSVGALAGLNGYLDRKPTVIRTATITGKHFSRNRRGTPSQFFATIRDWAGAGELEFRIPSNDYDRIQPQRTRLQVTVGAGALGLEWVEKKQVLPDEPVRPQ
jgi:hypothetical protein